MIYHRLSRKEQSRYKTDGYLAPLSVLTSDEVAFFRKKFDETLDAFGPEVNPHDIRQPQLHFDWAHTLSRYPRLVDYVEDLIGPDIMVCRGTFFWKDSGGDFYSFHQDAYPLGFSEEHADKFLTAWIALSPSTKANGCMQFVPGSHKVVEDHTDKIFENDFDQKSVVSRGLTVDKDTEQMDKVYVELEAGQMSVHHAHLLHGSGPNMTEDRRIGIVFRYQAPEVKQSIPLRHKVYMARGQDRSGLYEMVDAPPSKDLAAAVASSKAYVRNHEESEVFQKQSSLIRELES